MIESLAAAGPAQSEARRRILDSPYELFARRGVRDVGIDEVIERAAVAKATLYRHFKTKDDLVLAFLERRERLWTLDFVEAEARRRGSTPEEQLLAIFDAFDRARSSPRPRATSTRRSARRPWRGNLLGSPACRTPTLRGWIVGGCFDTMR